MTSLPPMPDSVTHPRALMIAYRGSVAHGMYTGGADGIDDIDLMGFFVAKPSHYIGFGLDSPDTKEIKDGPWDVVYYELRHFIRLLAKSNPNVLTMLWLKPEAILVDSETAKILRAFRKLFASKLAYNAFVGYARGQFERMTRFDGPERVKMRAIEDEVLRRGFTIEIRPEQLTKEQAGHRNVTGEPYANLSGKELVTTYREMRSKYTSGYQGEKRRRLVEQFGYDTKNAAHTLRILRMGIEFLAAGEMIVDRRDAGDAEEFLSVKRGDWALDAVKAKAEEMFSEAREVKNQSALPDEPDMAEVESLCMELIRREVRF